MVEWEMTTTKTTAMSALVTVTITTSMRKAENWCALVMSAVSTNTGVMRMSDDTISRKATIDAIEGVDWYHIDSDGQLTHGANSKDNEPLYKAKDVYAVLNTMPSAQPEIIRCKECKYWKDSDGVYRRGFDAESKCPLNLKKVYEGTFYCGMAERRTDE